MRLDQLAEHAGGVDEREAGNEGQLGPEYNTNSLGWRALSYSSRE